MLMQHFLFQYQAFIFTSVNPSNSQHSSISVSICLVVNTVLFCLYKTPSILTVDKFQKTLMCYIKLHLQRKSISAAESRLSLKYGYIGIKFNTYTSFCQNKEVNPPKTLVPPISLMYYVIRHGQHKLCENRTSYLHILT